MKTKNIVLIVLVCVVVLAVIGHEHGSLKRNTQHIQKITTEQKNTILELEKLDKEIKVLAADLNTFKRGNRDYIKEAEEMMDKETHQAKPKVAVVSIRKIFQGCKRGASYRKEAIAEHDRVVAELEELSRELEAERVGLTTLRENSSDYMARAKELFEKQANYQARQEFYKQQMELKDQLWTKELYQDISRVAGEVAKEQGFDLVFREDEIDFSETNITELGLAMSSQKLLYSGGCLDITDEVIARLDAEE